ncbi:putative protein phosphatase 2C 79-like isoform X2 [Carex littledalei]|uniref:protein-serine/threonine phosphatase n=1 Tax=Carex littledalei TaxID=544730 RepID=A0A833VRC9_9POAL|nr:putative protein phosphatase 2C 79-like isoform X2 [Carex littledalei]
MACNFLRRWFRGDESRYQNFLNSYDQFSMAVAPANVHNEDRSQLVSGSLTDRVNGHSGVFVGIYDGHGLEGATCSQFVLDNLFENFKNAMQNHDAVNPEVIQEAYHRTEVAFVDHVGHNWQNKPQLAVSGSCCLVGVVYNNVLYVANAGHSRAVLASWPDGGGWNDLEVIQLWVAGRGRAEVIAEHPPGTNLFIESAPGQWYIRGALQPTRTIGDVYLKYNEFNEAPLPDEYIQEEPIVPPILKAEPMIQTHQLSPDDRFVIFASHEFWDLIDNDQAVILVQGFPRNFWFLYFLVPVENYFLIWLEIRTKSGIPLPTRRSVRLKALGGDNQDIMTKATDRAQASPSLRNSVCC